MMQDITDRLFALQDLPYRDFTAKLIPTESKEYFIGVRMPLLRTLAKEIKNDPAAEEFLLHLPHKYYEENNLHGLLISEGKNYDTVLKQVNAFLPFVNNWATCDMLSPKVFKRHRKELESAIEDWLTSDLTYTVRFGIEMIQTHYLDEDFDARWLKRVASIRSDEYYINMMIAWFFATALTKQWQSALPYLENQQLSPWVHNKTIQKAVESYRITPEQKDYLKSMKLMK